MADTQLASVLTQLNSPDTKNETAVNALTFCLQTLDRGTQKPGWWANKLLSLVEIYGNKPFTDLTSAQTLLDLDREEFTYLLKLFEQVPELRDAVCNGPAGKYWTKTILPLERDGGFDDVLENQDGFPRIVGIYPGPSCMFRCHFCVRVTGARYPQETLTPGFEVLSAVIKSIPADRPDRLYFSGGLEPLTNNRMGDLAAIAHAQGFQPTLYTNAFALTETNLSRQPGLWKLGGIRVSLYGVSDEEYQQTVGKRGAFSRVKKNLQRFLELRAEQALPIQLGFSYLILPGRGDRLSELLHFLTELSNSTPQRPVDFIDLRQDYSGREDGNLSKTEIAQLKDNLNLFEEGVRQNLPQLRVDYGYALNSLRSGHGIEMLRTMPSDMRPQGHLPIAAQVDLNGDVYLYREAGFPDLEGADRYIVGRVTPECRIDEVVKTFLKSGKGIQAKPGDEYFLDGFDQVITARLNQLELDISNGWKTNRGFLRS